MKLTVKLENQTFGVEVGDIHARPILATVDGTTFEVWPEDTAQPAAQPVRPAAAPSAAHLSRTSQPPAGMPAPASTALAKTVLAPLPGVIVAIHVKPGTEVAHGQELCIIEAMKMKNVIRATRSGTIAAINVTLNQHVKHHDVLMEFAAG